MTLCNCRQPGYCRRHGLRKPEAWWKLCRTRDDYFQFWEEGRGPGQGHRLRRGPCSLRRFWNFMWAIWRHVRNRGLRVSREDYRYRLEICGTCASLEPSKRICLEHCCGCRVDVKARWTSEACPLRKWEVKKPYEIATCADSNESTLQQIIATNHRVGSNP